jgi:hypothetical protein
LKLNEINDKNSVLPGFPAIAPDCPPKWTADDALHRSACLGSAAIRASLVHRLHSGAIMVRATGCRDAKNRAARSARPVSARFLMA